MDIESVVAQLRQEASRIEQAIAALMALVGLGSQPARRGAFDNLIWPTCDHFIWPTPAAVS